MKFTVLAFFIFTFISCKKNDEQIIQPKTFPEFVSGTLDYQSRERKYILHIPSTYDGTKETPLVIFLHGGGGNAQSAQGFTNFNQVSKTNGFLMLYPQAFFEAGANSYVWADGRGLAPDVLGIDDVGFIDKLVTNLKAEYKVNAKKVYLCGFSNGSFLTQKIAFEKNAQYAAIGTLGGTMNQSLFNTGNPSRAIPMMYVFGTADPLVPYNGGVVSGPNTLPVVGIDQAVNYWVTKNQCQTTLPVVNVPNTNTTDNSTVTVYEYTNGTCNSKVKFYKITGGGHTFPGVKIPNQPTLGETNLDISASEELWNFFKQFELCP
jgi:polyhydroxybutyrate depolymerase